jgi:hypothetical protein
MAASAIGHERLVTKVAHFDHLGGEVGKSVEQVLPPAADSGVAVIAALDSGQERDGLHVSVHQFEKGIEVASAVARLFDSSRDPDERVRADEWFLGPPEFAALYAYDTVRQRRRWYRNLVAEGLIEGPAPR